MLKRGRGRSEKGGNKDRWRESGGVEERKEKYRETRELEWRRGGRKKGEQRGRWKR